MKPKVCRPFPIKGLSLIISIVVPQFKTLSTMGLFVMEANGLSGLVRLNPAKIKASTKTRPPAE